MKRKVMSALAAAVFSVTIGLAWAGTAEASTTASGAASTDSCSTWATWSWADNCQVSLGSSSNMVLAVQWIVSGACGGNGLTLDGVFGSNTEHAVECFQNQHGISPRGVVDSNTWKALRNWISLAPDTSAPGWQDYSIDIRYQYEFVTAFRQWISSGRWYVMGGSSFVPMTS